ncbi:MAG: hypothetical protein ACR2IK_03810 [Chloroflexota bacterium]
MTPFVFGQPETYEAAFRDATRRVSAASTQIADVRHTPLIQPWMPPFELA